METEDITVVRAYMDLSAICRAMRAEGTSTDDPIFQRASLACGTAGDDLIIATDRSPSYSRKLTQQVEQLRASKSYKIMV